MKAAFRTIAAAVICAVASPVFAQQEQTLQANSPCAAHANKAALHIAIEMANEGLITREEILARGGEALSGMGVLTDSVLRSAAMQFLKTEYAERCR